MRMMTGKRTTTKAMMATVLDEDAILGFPPTSSTLRLPIAEYDRNLLSLDVLMSLLL